MESARFMLATLAIFLTAFSTHGKETGPPDGVPQAQDVNPDPHVFETTIVAESVAVDLGNGVTANAYTYNGTVPGPEIRVAIGDRVIVHFRNMLPEASSIHWHGVEVNNASDGTAVTQAGVETGGTYTYDFIAPRSGIFWYHPHFRPTNPEFKGQYGAFIVTDENERKLIKDNVLPPKRNTRTLMLGDTTVCKAPGANDVIAFAADPTVPWSGGADFPGSNPGDPSPMELCENPRDNEGNFTGTGPLNAGDIPNVQPPEDCGAPGAPTCRLGMGQIVLVNGKVPAARAGSPDAPGELAADAEVWKVEPGQGIRLQPISGTVFRYFRLRLTDTAGNHIPLFRVGGEGGLLDQVRTEGGIQGTLDTKYDAGEILLSPADRADLVFVVPPEAQKGDVLTLWTRDYSHTGNGFALTPTVPVLHFEVGKKRRGHGRHGGGHHDGDSDSGHDADTGHYTATAGSGWGDRGSGHDHGDSDSHGGHHQHPPFSIDETVLLLADPMIGMPAEELDGLPVDELLDPSMLATPRPGSADELISFTTLTVDGELRPSIDGIVGHFDAGAPDFTAIPHVDSSRFARVGDLLELTIANTTVAHHPFHLHGFSFQPVRMEDLTGLVLNTYTYNEFLDNVDIPPQHRLVFRVRLEDRPLMDAVTPGGALGRWVFHCHIFFHAGLGMISELVVLPEDTTTMAAGESSAAAGEGDIGTSGVSPWLLLAAVPLLLGSLLGRRRNRRQTLP